MMMRARQASLSITILLLAGCSSDKVVSPAPHVQKIAFTSERTGLRQAYVMAVSGGGLGRISHTNGQAYSPKWSPNGLRLAYWSTDYLGDNGMDIFTVAPDGSGEINLTKSPGIFDSQPSWSPDGTHLALSTNRDGNSEIYVMGADGSGAQRLTNDPASDYGPMWSPRGDWIAFTSSANETTDLYVMRPNGTGVKRLTRTPTVEYDPQWSPDGSSIAFWGGNIDSTQIYVVSPDSSTIQRVTNSPIPVQEPSWSPDGARIAYAADDGLHIVHRDGSNGAPIPGTSHFDHQPTWSPDGNTIAFVSTEPGNLEIYLIAPDGSGRQNLTQNLYEDKAPAWEPLRGH